MLDSRLATLQERLLMLDKSRTLEDSKHVVRAVLGLLLPDVDKAEFKLFRDGDGKLSANGGWFYNDDEIADQLATYSMDLPPESNLDVKVFGLTKPNMRNTSWVVGLTPNFEDEPFNGKFNVGLDFVIPETKDRIILALSSNHAIRTIELKGQLTATFLEILGSWLQIKDTSGKRELHTLLWDSLDLHPINKKFYEGISQRFVSLRQHLESSGLLDTQSAAHFSNRLVGRLIFTWFLEKKELINPDANYFTSEEFDDDSDYYRQRLEPLFFEVLNTEPQKRTVKDLLTPYLNGGLFEPKKSDYYGLESLSFPPNYFYEFFAFLRSYNFTTDESTSEFQQVAIDPEMLGRIFENLLAEISEDTGEQARKAKGAFYTPRLVVDYMCKEALKGYLRSAIRGDDNFEARLHQLIEASERQFQDQDHNWRRDLKPYKEDLLTALDGLRVLDPACGSGAFPIGMMQLLMKVYARLEARFDPHKTKLGIIERNIFGVDIEPMAVEISRLRAWLALIVDIDSEKVSVPPLPNLEFKFVCANTLLYPEDKGQLSFGEDHDLDRKLQVIRDDYFSTKNTSRKLELRAQYFKMTSEEASLFGESLRTSQLKSFKPFEADSSAEFFDPQQMFGVSSFQIILGNPPYVNVEKVSAQIKNAVAKYKTAFKKYDLYVLFYERALGMLSKDGILSYITSNKFLSQPYGKLLRQELLRHRIMSLVNFNCNIFESATVSTCILTLQKSTPLNNQVMVLEVDTKDSAVDFYSKNFRSIYQSLFESLDDYNFRLTLDDEKIELLAKIRSSHPILEQICSVNLGIKAHAKDGSFKKSDMIFDSSGEGRRNFFEAKDVGYWTVKHNGYVKYEPEKMYAGMFSEIFDNPKLAAPRIVGDLSSLRFGYEETGMVCSHTAVVLMFWHYLEGADHVTVRRTISDSAIDLSRNFDYKYLQGVLNSLVIKFYFSELMWDKLNFYPNQMKSLPIPQVSYGIQQSISEIVLNLQNAGPDQNGPHSKILRRELDDLVFEAFDLSQAEADSIRKWLPDLDWK